LVRLVVGILRASATTGLASYPRIEERE